MPGDQKALLMTAIRAVVFDIGGVVEIPPDLRVDRLWEARLGLPTRRAALTGTGVGSGAGLLPEIEGTLPGLRFVRNLHLPKLRAALERHFTEDVSANRHHETVAAA
jgi:hypothetical protein